MKHKLRNGLSTSFGDELQKEGLDGEWHLFASKTVGFIDLAKSFDLTILGQLSPDARSIGFPPGETMAATGRPVLVIPYAETIDNVGRRPLSLGMEPTRRCGQCMARCRCSIGPKP
jgi:hypothetical protein